MSVGGCCVEANELASMSLAWCPCCLDARFGWLGAWKFFYLVYYLCSWLIMHCQVACVHESDMCASTGNVLPKLAPTPSHPPSSELQRVQVKVIRFNLTMATPANGRVSDDKHHIVMLVKASDAMQCMLVIWASTEALPSCACSQPNMRGVQPYRVVSAAVFPVYLLLPKKERIVCTYSTASCFKKSLAL